MCYKTIQAFKASDGHVFESERDVVAHEIAIVLNDTDINPLILLDEAQKLVPLLQRGIAIASATTAKSLPPAGAKKDPPAGETNNG